jgi:hypothetical protein
MTAAIPNPYRVMIDAVQYTGSNAREIMAYIDTVFTPEVCTLEGNTINCFVGQMNPSDWFIQERGSASFVLGGNLVTLNRVPSIISNSVLTPSLRLDGPPPETIALGFAPIPPLAASAQANIPVTLVPSFTTPNYVATAVVTGAVNLLASLSVVSVNITSPAIVSVVVRNTGLLSLSGGSVLVAAIHN